MNGAERAEQTLHFVFDRGLAGQHLLFDMSLIRETFDDGATEGDALPDGLDERNIDWSDRVGRALRHIAALPSMDEQRQFVTALPRALQHRLCFHYFALLDDRAERVLH